MGWNCWKNIVYNVFYPMLTGSKTLPKEIRWENRLEKSD